MRILSADIGDGHRLYNRYRAMNLPGRFPYTNWLYYHMPITPGKITTAPCGCPGEVIIGNYARCLAGCDSGKKSKALSGRRGEPGHVDDCACKKCQVRRAGTLLLFRSEDGRDMATLPWNGTDKSVKWKSAYDGRLRHWIMLDDSDLIVASGTLDVAVKAGWNFTAEIDSLVGACMQVSVVGSKVTHYDPSKVVLTFNGVKLEGFMDGTFPAWTFEES